jgi:PhnB protein
MERMVTSSSAAFYAQLASRDETNHSEFFTEAITSSSLSRTEVLMSKAASHIPEGYHSVTPQLILDNAAQSIDWYKKAFGAEEIGRSTGPDGKIMHAELKIGNARIMVNDAMAGHKGPKALGGTPISLWLYVENSDTVFNRAVSAGAKVQMPLADQFWGDRAGSVVDPAGHSWWIATRTEDLAKAEIERRAQEFFAQMAQPTR